MRSPGIGGLPHAPNCDPQANDTMGAERTLSISRFVAENLVLVLLCLAFAAVEVFLLVRAAT